MRCINGLLVKILPQGHLQASKLDEPRIPAAMTHGECQMNKPEEEPTLHLRPRVTETVSIEIQTDTLDSLKKVAASRDMSYEALLKLYIGQGLRQDLAKLFSDLPSRLPLTKATSPSCFIFSDGFQ